VTRQRVAAQPVQGQREPDDQDDERGQRGAAAQRRGEAAAARAPARGALPAGALTAGAPGPVTPVTSAAVAEPVELIESMPMIDSTCVGAVTVTVTWMDCVPTGFTVPW
jgi:hypothetical protein